MALATKIVISGKSVALKSTQSPKFSGFGNKNRHFRQKCCFKDHSIAKIQWFRQQKSSFQEKVLLLSPLNCQNSVVSATKIVISGKSVAFKTTQLLKSSVNGNNFRYFKHLCCFFDRLAAEFQRRWQQKNRPEKSGRFFIGPSGGLLTCYSLFFICS